MSVIGGIVCTTFAPWSWSERPLGEKGRRMDPGSDRPCQLAMPVAEDGEFDMVIKYQRLRRRRGCEHECRKGR